MTLTDSTSSGATSSGATSSGAPSSGATSSGATSSGVTPTDVATAPAATTGSARTTAKRPRWIRPAVAALLIGTAVLYLWDLSASGWANAFYSAAVQAGTKSWKAFFFGSSDASS